MGKSCAINLRVAGSSPAGQLLIYFHNVSPVLTKTLCGHSSLVPRPRIKAFVRRPRCCLPRLRPLPQLFLTFTFQEGLKRNAALFCQEHAQRC